MSFVKFESKHQMGTYPCIDIETYPDRVEM